MLGQNHFDKPNWHVLTSLHPILICKVTYWAPVELLLHGERLDRSVITICIKMLRNMGLNWSMPADVRRWVGVIRHRSGARQYLVALSRIEFQEPATCGLTLHLRIQDSSKRLYCCSFFHCLGCQCWIQDCTQNKQFMTFYFAR
jgi:hypothetical protein